MHAAMEMGNIDFKVKILGALSVVGVLQYAFLPLAFPKLLVTIQLRVRSRMSRPF